MGLLDLLAGPKAQRQPITAEESSLRQYGAGLYGSAERGQYTNLRGMAIRAAGRGRNYLLREQQGTQGADIAQATAGAPVSTTGALDRAMTRGRGLARMARSTSDEFDTATMRERLGIVKGMRGSAGTGIRALAGVAGARTEMAGADDEYRRAKQGFWHSIIGTAVGAGAGAYANRRPTAHVDPGVAAWNRGETY